MENNSVIFWLAMFEKRSKQWRKDTLERLKSKVSMFETLEENQNR